MSEHHEQDRNEAPTPRRREDARREGRVVFSSDLTLGVILLLASLAMPWIQRDWQQRFATMVNTSQSHLTPGEWGIPQTVLACRWMLAQSLFLAGPVCGAIWLLSVVSSQWQAGAPAVHELKLDWTRLWSPGRLSRMFSGEQFISTGQGILKVTTTLVIGLVVLYQHWPDPQSGTAELSTAMMVWGILNVTLFYIGLGALAWGLVDFAIKWQQHESKLMMSREEVKQESKEDSGDPQLRHRRRQMHRDALNRRSLQNVPQASLVVRNPTHFAVAIKYVAGQSGAPVVVAKGTGAFALRIIATAQEHGVPVLERKPLARALYHLTDVGQEIPAELFHAAAEVLAFVFRVRNRRRVAG